MSQIAPPGAAMYNNCCRNMRRLYKKASIWREKYNDGNKYDLYTAIVGQKGLKTWRKNLWEMGTGFAKATPGAHFSEGFPARGCYPPPPSLQNSVFFIVQNSLFKQHCFKGREQGTGTTTATTDDIEKWKLQNAKLTILLPRDPKWKCQCDMRNSFNPRRLSPENKANRSRWV